MGKYCFLSMSKSSPFLSVIYGILFVITHVMVTVPVSSDNLRRFKEGRHQFNLPMTFDFYQMVQIFFIGIFCFLILRSKNSNLIAITFYFIVFFGILHFNYLHLFDQFSATLILIYIIITQKSRPVTLVFLFVCVYLHWQTALMFIPIIVWSKIQRVFKPWYLSKVLAVVLSFTVIYIMQHYISIALSKIPSFTISKHGNLIFDSYSSYAFAQTAIMGLPFFFCALVWKDLRFLYDVYFLFAMITYVCYALALSEEFYFRLVSSLLFVLYPIFVSIVIERVFAESLNANKVHKRTV